MRFSVGIWDSLFGEKVSLEIPGHDGTIIRRQVTKRWLESMQQGGKMTQIPSVRVHLIHPAGNRDLDWVIGTDVSQETVDRFRDSETGDLYAMTYFQAGEPKMTVLKRSFWEKTIQLMDTAGVRGAEAAIEGLDQIFGTDKKSK
jgi:hypothetical protein